MNGQTPIIIVRIGKIIFFNCSNFKATINQAVKVEKVSYTSVSQPLFVHPQHF